MRFMGSKAEEARTYLSSWRLQFDCCIVENFRGQNTKYNYQGNLSNEVTIQFRLLCGYRVTNFKDKKGVASISER